MRVRRLVLALSAVTALTFALAAPAVATQGQHVPFQMHLVGVDQPLNMSAGFPVVRDTFAGRCSVPSDWVTTIDSSGTAAHLGSVSVLQSHCTQIDIFTTPNPATVVDGRMTISAADGDELWLTYSGGFIFTPTTAVDVGISDITYTSMTIIGGTGRFDGATGALTGTAVDNFPAGPHTASFTGWIVYDPSVQAH